MTSAIKVILREHGSIGAVLHGLRFLVKEIREGRQTPNFQLLHAMVYYIDAVPERIHHPKEDHFLFSKLKARTHELDASLERLEEQHAQGALLTRQLEEAITLYETESKGGFEAFARCVEQYTEFYWQHMREEEELILPVAERVLTAVDWAEINAAFAENSDPLGGGQLKKDLQDLFHKIAMLAPSPIGLGGRE